MGDKSAYQRRDENDLGPFGKHEPSSMTALAMRLAGRQTESWLSRRFAFWLRRMAIDRLSGPVDTTALGARMRLYPFNTVCEKRILFTPQYFDKAERDLLASRIKPGFTFIDIGANVGGYALFVAALAGPGARILAIEPQPVIFERLVYNIGQNPFGTLKAIACAVADHDGDLTLFVDTHNRGQSSVKMVAGSAGRGAAVRVPAKMLTTILREEAITRIDAAKLDVEGAEDLILEPFLRDAPRSLLPKILIMENAKGRWQHDVRARLVEHGYRKILETRLNLAFELD
jgi:FkbM family methyltransferase